MSERINKTSIYSIIFLDIIDYSKKAVSLQIEQKEAFNKITTQALDGIAPSDRIILDTGDGLAIALLGEPQEALFVSLTIRDDIVQYNIDRQSDLFVRIGINLGPVRVVKDINGRPNIIGDGINVAERVMSFAKPNQILVSRTYYEVTSRLTDEINVMFSYFGMKQDKHVREHEIYEINAEAKTVKSLSEVNGVKQSSANPISWHPSSVWLNRAQLLDKNFWLEHKYYLLVSAVLLALVILFSLPKSTPEITINGDESAEVGSANTLTIVPGKPDNIDATLDLSHLKTSEPVVTDVVVEEQSVDFSKDSSAKLSTTTKPKTSKKLNTRLPETPLPPPILPAQTDLKKQAGLEAKKVIEAVPVQVAPAPAVIEEPIRQCTQAEKAMNQCH